MAKFKRILLKLSGESLAGEQKQGINVERLNQYAQQIKEIAEMGVQIGTISMLSRSRRLQRWGCRLASSSEVAISSED